MDLLGGVGLALVTAALLSWKWQLGVIRALVVVGLLAGAVAGVLALWAGDAPVVLRVIIAWTFPLALALALVANRFLRDPPRTPPDRDDVVVSPADGKVIYVRRSEGGELPVSTKHGRRYRVEDLVKTPLAEEEAVVVGISLNLLDVHVNRTPTSGTVTLAQRYAGTFGSMRKPEMAFENERATVLIDGRDLQLAVVIIASRLVRQISLYIKATQHVALGQRLGVIRLGSQVDLVLPSRPDVHVLVRPGDRVRAGESIVATIAVDRERPAPDLVGITAQGAAP